MKLREKYVETLKTFNDFVTISDWAIKFVEMFPDEYEKVIIQAKQQKNSASALRLVTTRISSIITMGRLSTLIKIDESEHPKKVKYITKEELEQIKKEEIEEDIEPLRRQDIIKNTVNKMDILSLYKISEFENIQKSFKQYFGIDFEIDHAEALLNNHKQGEHHPDNFQFLLKYHNSKKNNNNWKRFTFKEQISYIEKVINLQNSVADKLEIKIDNKILESLFKRLENIY